MSLPEHPSTRQREGAGDSALRTGGLSGSTLRTGGLSGSTFRTGGLSGSTLQTSGLSGSTSSPSGVSARFRGGRKFFPHSLRTKITALTLAAILVSVLAVGGISIYSIKQEEDRESLEKLTLICDNRRRKLNEYLDSIEQSVDMVSRYAEEELSGMDLMAGGVLGATGYGGNLRLEERSEEQRSSLDSFLWEHARKLDTVFRSVASHTNGVLTYYYRVNPELSDTVRGFWYSRRGATEFVGLEPTDIPGFPREDTEHVGWFYIPLSRGRPSWLEPYHNANLDTVIISYVSPIYKAGTFVGVIGMDINYQTLVAQIECIQVYKSGYACLTDEKGNVFYHPSLDRGVNLEEEEPSLQGLPEWLRSADRSEESLLYSYDGVDRMMVFHTLSNGMKLLVTAPVSEINANWLSLGQQIAETAILILMVFVGAMFYLVNRVTEPLQRLTRASRQLADGQYDVDLGEIGYDGKDEVGILTAAFQRLVNHLRVYISDLNSRAYQDAMTGVKNKGAFNITAQKLNDAITQAEQSEGGGQLEFAVIMMDCNNLKTINDQYGHNKGDQYLKTACDLICKVFAHSSVFRLGGDEFAVVLQQDDYAAREVLLREFVRRSAMANLKAVNPWDEVWIAKGMAAYDPQEDTGVESVLHRADEQMYMDKQRMKKGQVR